MSSLNLNESKPSKFLNQPHLHLSSQYPPLSNPDSQEHRIPEAKVQHLNAHVEEVQRRNLELEHALKFELTLRHISDKVRDSLDQNQILQNTVKELAIALDLHFCEAVLCGTDANTSTTRYFYSTTAQDLTPEQQTYIRETSPDIREQFQKCPCHYVVCQFHRLSACEDSLSVACPIIDTQIGGREVLGVLWLIRDDASHFSEVEFLLIQQVAAQCAIALNQARCYAKALANVQEQQRLNQLKDDFLSAISHELRTPLANIKMTISMLDAVADPTHVLFETVSESPESPVLGIPIQYIDVLEEESARALKLVEDLLHLQHLEAKTEPQPISSVNLREWLHRLIQSFEKRTQNHRQNLQVNLAPDLPFLMFDHFSLSRIVTELLSNACKYTCPGETISVQAKLVGPDPSGDSATLLQLIVTNTGTEIPADELPRVFDTFYRIPNHDHWKQGGTGLGLALVKKLVEHLHGSIDVVSANNQTQFWVHLPIEVYDTTHIG